MSGLLVIFAIDAMNKREFIHRHPQLSAFFSPAGFAMLFALARVPELVPQDQRKASVVNIVKDDDSSTSTGRKSSTSLKQKGLHLLQLLGPEGDDDEAQKNKKWLCAIYALTALNAALPKFPSRARKAHVGHGGHLHGVRGEHAHQHTNAEMVSMVSMVSSNSNSSNP